ncbi:MAG TPA: hypothetical protein PKA98_15175, partial [Acidimicrobiales bacterium]|nr:hypothetical protein [Acidimicrobiales bacterium]
MPEDPREEPLAEPLVEVNPDDEARVERRSGQLLPGLCFGLSIAAALGLAVVYAAGGQTQAEGVLLFVALGGIGEIGMNAYLYG